MIRITISLKKDSGKISAQGHAGEQYGAPGENLLCCAVTTLIGAMDVNFEGLDGIEVTGHAQSGDVLLEWKRSGGAGMKLANQYAGFFAKAMLALAENYPEEIKLEMNGGTEHDAATGDPVGAGAAGHGNHR